MSHLITLLTDFGDMDGFVGAMRGVIVSRTPAARLVDLAHHVPRGDIAKAARVLARAAPCFPRGTVHCVVVDPGVGSSRRAIVARAGGQDFVAPDNGVLTDVLAALGPFTAREIVDPRLMAAAPSSTFHGRDVFAPTAAALADGFAFVDVGPRCETIVRLDRSAPAGSPEGWIGTVIEVDRFGNLITDLPVAALPARVRVELGGVCLGGFASAYAAVEPGELVVLAGSEGTLEIAVRDGSAAARLTVSAGEPVACFEVDDAR